MPVTLVVRDESTAGSVGEPITLSFPTETITVRELIRERVYQEVQDFNRAKDQSHFKGLVQPTDTEVSLNGFTLKKRREIDWKAQFDRACDAYTKNRVLVLVGDRQTESLDETLTITRGVDVTFLKLVPLVGG